MATYTTIVTWTAPSEEIKHFRMPESSLIAKNRIIAEMGEKVISNRVSRFGPIQTIENVFLNEEASQEYSEKTAADPDIIKARIAQTEYNEIFGIKFEIHKFLS